MRATVLLLLIFSFKNFVDCSTRNDCICGQSNSLLIKRIVNGYEVIAHQYPWMAAMLSPSGINMCGGSIISDKNVITAGHCLYYLRTPLETKWLFGAHSISNAKKISGNIYRTFSYVFHPKYNPSPTFDDYDMSVVTVDRPINFNLHINPICLPQINEYANFYKKKVKVAGWGKLSDAKNSPVPDQLMETNVFLKTPKTCQAMTKLNDYNTKSMICAHDIGTDACMGDSGGPLFAQKNSNQFVILGIVSFGEGCANDFPGVYAQIANKQTLNWVRRTINSSGANTCSESNVNHFRNIIFGI